MDYAKLREWLKMKPGMWPPTDRELLGFTESESVDPATVELRALERMDILRPRQLVEPDLVTEGMNRLAQAMISLSVKKTNAVPIKRIRKPVREKTPVEIRKPVQEQANLKTKPDANKTGKQEVELDLSGPASQISSPQIPSPNPQSLGSQTVAIPVILEAEVIDVDEPVSPQFIPDSTAVVSDEKEAAVLNEPINLPDPPPGTVLPPSSRRMGYAELAHLRKIREIWQQFRVILGVPSENLQTPAKITQYLDAIHDLRKAVKKHRKTASEKFPDQAGQLVFSVLFHSTPLSLLREMQPQQRLALARDWAVTNADIEAKLTRLRQVMRSRKINRPGAKFLGKAFDLLGKNPEWILALLIVAMLVVGVMRKGN